MKGYLALSVLLIFLMTGCAHSPRQSSSVLPSAQSAPQILLASTSGEIPVKASGKSADAINDEYKDEENIDYADDKFKEEKVEIADPLEPVNRVMHLFNDKLYLWALKPAAQGYKAVTPEVLRISARNFFSNLRFPSRFLSCLLQSDFSGAATEAGRFTINTVWGIGGLMDPASGKALDLQMQDTDLGQTLGVWGVGQGFYIVWPVYGPSSPRDSIDIAGDNLLYPVSYINPWYAWLGVWGYEKINATSLRIGDYEALKDAAIDPYVAFRDAYIQYRLKRVKARKAKVASSMPSVEESGSANPVLPAKGN
ncbi:MAG: VacJ family lipoprotein [Deltaproteobacteria bacterium HGW-Deltaproteobacteria-13]|jgi:phospholipid-binding lipoprotein MlaA|nr:MAG: VacJ family lipoprotein [Deltaproteobacteria bacterium HGW-Deltaproteobacteria-13]